MSQRRCRLSTLVFALWAASTALVFADGGTVRLSERQGPYRLAVFTSPQPLRAGPVDISVLVQDAVTGEPLQDVAVKLELTGPAGAALHLRATPGAATNQLFQAAQFELPAAEVWEVRVMLDGPRGPAAASFTMAAAEAMPRWTQLLFWLALPAVCVLLFVLHQLVLRAGARG